MHERSFSLFSARLGELLERINVFFPPYLVYVLKLYRRTTIGNDNAVRDLFRSRQYLIAADQSDPTDQRIHSDQRSGVRQGFIQRIGVQVGRFFDELRIQLLAM